MLFRHAFELMMPTYHMLIQRHVAGAIGCEEGDAKHVPVHVRHRMGVWRIQNPASFFSNFFLTMMMNELIDYSF